MLKETFPLLCKGKLKEFSRNFLWGNALVFAIYSLMLLNNNYFQNHLQVVPPQEEFPSVKGSLTYQQLIQEISFLSEKELIKLMQDKEYQINLVEEEKLAAEAFFLSLLANISSSPYKKLDYLGKSISNLNCAISKYPSSLLLRKIRYQLNKNVPWIFRNNEFIEKDLTILQKDI